MTALQNSLDALSASADEKPFDTIIVGGGSSGLATARTLFERGLKVAVIEAGPAPFLTHITNTELRFARGLTRNLRDAVQYRPPLASGGYFGNNYGCLGGRGLFWNGAAPQFCSVDFTGWPFTKADLTDDYSWAEQAFRVSRSMGETALGRSLRERLRDAGYDARPGPYAADIDGLVPGRLSAGIASGLGFFWRGCGDAVAAGKLLVAISTRVEAVLHENGHVTGARLVDSTGMVIDIPARSVVLAAGGIESIAIAALSGVPDPSERIGKGLQEHLFYHVLADGPALYDPVKPDSAIIHIPSKGQDTHQWEIHVPGNRLFAVDDGSRWAPATGAAYQLMLRAFAATTKRDDNRVEARPGALGASLVHFTHDAADEERKATMADDAARLGAALGLVVAEGPGFDDVARIRAPGSSYHEAGGLDMGTDRDCSVTNPQGEFHHMSGLVCADAAAFPRIGATNPHLTIVAVARRQARALAERLA